MFVLEIIHERAPDNNIRNKSMVQCISETVLPTAKTKATSIYQRATLKYYVIFSSINVMLFVQIQ